ncbi:MAG: prolyl hydroxylase family protein [Cytophagaceae bacterium]
MKLFRHNESIWTIDNFISKEECEDLINFSENAGYQEAEVSTDKGSKMIKGIRNNYRVIHQDLTLAEKLWGKLKEFCPSLIENNTALGLNEQFRFYKYESEQRFKRHIDGRFKRNDLEESRITFMIYLNEDFEGGETVFDEISIRPRTGSVLCFIHELKHEGAPVKNGIKYVLRSDVMYGKI